MENRELVAAVEELIQETRCPICLDFFVKPRTTPCTHSFCEACIYECIKDNHSECPSCRYPGCNKRALTRNITLSNVTTIVRKVAVIMGLAEEETPSQALGQNESWTEHSRRSERKTVPKKRRRKGNAEGQPYGGFSDEEGGSVQDEGSGEAGVQQMDATSSAPAAHPSSRPVVLLTGVTGENSTSLAAAVTSLGGRVTRTFDLSVSHVVCRVDENRYTPRTLKYCCGLLSGAHLVSPAWLAACQAAKAWRAPSPIEQVQGCAVPSSSRGRSLHKGPRRRQQVRLNEARERGEHSRDGGLHARAETEPGRRLLTPPQVGGRRFFLLGAFDGCPSRSDLQQLLSLAGAELVQHAPATPKEARGTLCVWDPKSPACAVLESVVSLGVPCVKPNYVLDCVSHFEERPVPLSSTEDPPPPSPY